MAKITFITPVIKRDSFSGGLLCDLEYAAGLKKNGHEVYIVPMVPSDYPEWFDKDMGTLITKDKTKLKEVFFSAVRLLFSIPIDFFRGERVAIRKNLEKIVYLIISVDERLLGYEIKKGFSLKYLRGLIPNSDITIATSSETVLPTLLYGKGKKMFFAQHLETLMKDDFPNPELAFFESDLSFKSKEIEMICNSSWLKSQLNLAYGINAHLCLNAINHNVFNFPPRTRYENNKQIIVISYGGRNVKWKGFLEMAQAISIVRQRNTEYEIIWNVYGQAILPPINDIANYNSLGFLKPNELAVEYKKSDILLSASWYESFPLFPLEAMSCGLAVITGEYGTEDYAIHLETAMVIVPQQIDTIVNALEKLVTDVPFYNKITHAGFLKSKELTWEKSIARFEQIILSV